MSAFITVLATFCHLVTVPGPELCVEERITDNTLDDTVTMQSCMMGMAYVADWQAKSPLYHTWRLANWKCRIGNKPMPDQGGKA